MQKETTKEQAHLKMLQEVYELSLKVSPNKNITVHNMGKIREKLKVYLVQQKS